MTLSDRPSVRRLSFFTTETTIGIVAKTGMVTERMGLAHSHLCQDIG